MKHCATMLLGLLLLPACDERVTWHREGETFETLTLRPSILRSRENGGCGWHEFITNGDVIQA